MRTVIPDRAVRGRQSLATPIAYLQEMLSKSNEIT